MRRLLTGALDFCQFIVFDFCNRFKVWRLHRVVFVLTRTKCLLQKIWLNHWRASGNEPRRHITPSGRRPAWKRCHFTWYRTKNTWAGCWGKSQISADHEKGSSLVFLVCAPVCTSVWMETLTSSLTGTYFLVNLTVRDNKNVPDWMLKASSFSKMTALTQSILDVCVASCRGRPLVVTLLWWNHFRTKASKFWQLNLTW